MMELGEECEQDHTYEEMPQATNLAYATGFAMTQADEFMNEQSARPDLGRATMKHMMINKTGYNRSKSIRNLMLVRNLTILKISLLATLSQLSHF